MVASRSLLVIGLFCISSVLSEKLLCNDLGNSNCLTKSAGPKFTHAISGVPGVESSEPLYANSIEGHHPELSYTYTEAKLSGMKNCKVELVKLTERFLRYEYILGCPHLTLETLYELKGAIGELPIEGKGNAKVDYYDIQFVYHGEYANKEGAEGKKHINFKTQELDVLVKGKMQFDLKNLFDGDKEKSDFAHKAINDNWEPVAKAYSKESLQPFMDKYFSNVNAYLDIISTDDLFSYEQ